MRGLNLNQVQAFLDVVELGSFSAAAERAGLTQPAISLQVRELERQLQVSLIERVGRRAQPSPAGAAFLDYARQLSHLTSAAADEMARYSTGAMGRLRIGTGATACIYLLPAVLRQLKQRFPTLEITVSTGNTSDFVKAVEANTIDLGFVTLPVTSRALEIIPVLDDEFVAIGPPDFDWPEVVDRELLSRYPLILFEPGGSTRRIADEWLSQRTVAPKPTMALGSVEAIKELVSAGLGCAILPSVAVRDKSHSVPLTVRALLPRLHRTLAIIVRKDKKLHRALREAIQALKALAVSQEASESDHANVRK